MGLGTNDPNSYGGSVKLAVANTSGTCGLSIVSATNGDGNLYYADGTSGDATYRGYIRYNHTTDQFRIGVAGAEKVRITSAGDVGIGEDSPTERLVIQETNASGDVAVRIKNDTLTDGSASTPTTASLYLNTSTGDFNTFYIQARRYDNDTHFGYSNPRDGGHTPNMIISNEGRITMPNQPAFCVYKNQSQWALAAGDTFVFNTAEFNVGGHYNTSNGRFTAPVSGTYVFHFYSIYTGNAGNDYVQMYKNGARINVGDVHFTNSVGSQWDSVHYSRVIQLNANDYVYMRTGSGHTFHGNNWGGWSGYMLG